MQCRAERFVLRGPRASRGWAKNGLFAPWPKRRQAYPKLPDVADIYELMEAHKTRCNQAPSKVVLASLDLGRPFIAPPGMAADRVKLLRDALTKARPTGPCRRRSEKEMGFRSLNGAELEATAKEIMVQPPKLSNG